MLDTITGHKNGEDLTPAPLETYEHTTNHNIRQHKCSVLEVPTKSCGNTEDRERALARPQLRYIPTSANPLKRWKIKWAFIWTTPGGPYQEGLDESWDFILETVNNQWRFLSRKWHAQICILGKDIGWYLKVEREKLGGRKRNWKGCRGGHSEMHLGSPN